MSGIIRVCYSTGGNKSPIIRNFRQDGKIETTFFSIKYIAEDFENTILRHYLYIDGKKKEITKDVGYEQPNNEFSYKISELKLNTMYRIQIEVTDGINAIRSDILNITTANNPIYGIKVMENNSNPSTCCTYIEDARGIEVANSTSLGGWVDKFPFNKIELVGFKNGNVVNKINPSNKKSYINGDLVQEDEDVMVKIPKIYWEFKNIENGYELRISEMKFSETCDCYAHKINNIEKDFIYVGAYLGNIEYGKLRSKSGVEPFTNQYLNFFRTVAQANGDGYQQMNWNTLLLLQILYLIAYKNLNSQAALGKGYCNGASVKYTGGTDTKGMIYGELVGNQQMCFLGIEDLWGNLFQWIDGILYNNYYQILVTHNNKDFNNEGSNYKNIGQFLHRDEYGYLSKVSHTNESGFFPIEFDGSDSSKYADYTNIYKNCIANFGGNWNANLRSGIFCLNISYGQFGTSAEVGSRLCYLG